MKLHLPNGLVLADEEVGGAHRKGSRESRPFLLRDPYWPLHAAKTLGLAVTWPVQYQRAVE